MSIESVSQITISFSRIEYFAKLIIKDFKNVNQTERLIRIAYFSNIVAGCSVLINLSKN